MKRSHGLFALSGLAVAALFAGCSDDPPASNPGPSVGGSTAGTASPAAGTSTAAGTTSGGTFGSGGTGGETGGSAGASAGGTTAGTGGTAAGSGGTGGTTAGTGGTGGTAPAIVSTVFLIDNVRLVPKADAAGGAGGAGAGGATGDAGAGGAANALPDVSLTFDANLGPFKINSAGFSPGVTGETNGTPEILPATTLLWEAATGNPGGAAKASIPFSVPNQQADFGSAFAVAADLTGYELTADVKMTTIGTAGSCASVFIYVYGGTGYANDPTMDLAMGVTRHLVKGEWTRARLDLDGPYGYHSTANHPNFKPTNVTVWGVQFNTFGCP
jgi:hypothetical protein